MHSLRLALLCLGFAGPSLAFARPQGGEEDAVKRQFEALDDKHDRAGVVALWKAHPYETLGVIDTYLEGSLAKLEHAPNTDPAELRKMRDRGIRGASAADEAFGSAIFTDYATSFAGWNSEQQKSFREGQKAFGLARKAARANDFETSLREAERCVALARPLGDWWGTAMGLSASGQAHARLGHAELALEALSQSRLLNHELGLAGSEYSDLLQMAQLCTSLGRRDRALVAIERGLKLGDELGDADGPIAMLELRAQLEEAAGGDASAAKAAREELARRKAAKPGAKK